MISKSSLQQILGYLLIFFVMFWTYKEYINPIYGYQGFGLNINHNKFIFSIFAVLVISFFLPHRFKKPSDIFLHIQFIIPVLPMLVIYSADNQSTLFMVAALFVFFIVFIISNLVQLKTVRLVKISSKSFQRLLFLLSFMIIASIILFGGLSYLNFDMAKVYDFRENAANNLPSIFGYISPLASKVLLPFSMLLAVIHRQWLLVLLSFFGSVMMFGLTAHKGPLFYPFVVLIVYYALNHNRAINIIVWGALFICVLSLIDFYTGFSDGWVGSLMIRRTFLTPADIHFAYYDFFSNSPFVYWAESKISFGLIDYPYDLPSSKIIGRDFYGFDGLNANTGWIGSGYLNAGVTGMVVYAVLVGLLLSLLNAYTKKIDKPIIVSIILAPMMALMFSSDLPTALLNHGIILSVLLFSLFTVKTNNNIGRVK